MNPIPATRSPAARDEEAAAALPALADPLELPPAALDPALPLLAAPDPAEEAEADEKVWVPTAGWKKVLPPEPDMMRVAVLLEEVSM